MCCGKHLSPLKTEFYGVQGRKEFHISFLKMFCLLVLNEGSHRACDLLIFNRKRSKMNLICIFILNICL